MALNDTPRLPCGRPVDQVWIDFEDSPTPHEQGCVYCQAARRSLDDLTTATQTLRITDGDNPDLQMSTSITANVMHIARAEVRRARRIPLDQPRPGATPDVSLTISEQAIATVIRHIADTTTEGAEARHCRINVDLTAPNTTSSTLDANNADEDGADVATPLQIELTVSLPIGSSLRIAADRLRMAIAQGVSDQLGLTPSRIDIVVEDLHDLT